MTTVLEQIRKLAPGQTIRVKLIGEDHPLAQHVKVYHLDATYEIVFDRAVVRLLPLEEVQHLAEKGKMPKQISTIIWGRGLADQVPNTECPGEILGFGFHDWLIDSIEVVG